MSSTAESWATFAEVAQLYCARHNMADMAISISLDRNQSKRCCRPLHHRVRWPPSPLRVLRRVLPWFAD